MARLTQILAVLKSAKTADNFSKSTIDLVKNKLQVVVSRWNDSPIVVLSVIKENGESYTFNIYETELEEMVKNKSQIESCYYDFASNLKKKDKDCYKMTVYKWNVIDCDGKVIKQDEIGTFFKHEAEHNSSAFMDSVGEDSSEAFLCSISEHRMLIPTEIETIRYVILESLHQLETTSGSNQDMLHRIQKMKPTIDIACSKFKENLRLICARNNQGCEIIKTGEEDVGCEIVEFARYYSVNKTKTDFLVIPDILKPMVAQSLSQQETGEIAIADSAVVSVSADTSDNLSRADTAVININDDSNDLPDLSPQTYKRKKSKRLDVSEESDDDDTPLTKELSNPSPAKKTKKKRQ